MKRRFDRTFLVLKQLSGTRDFVSGQALGEMLGISRAGVLRHIDKLRGMGYVIDSESRKGHRLLGGEVYCAYSVELCMRNPLPVTFFAETASTNDEARRLPGRAGMAVAERQTEGRGRKSRAFFSGPGGVYQSVWFEPAYFEGQSLTPREALKSVLFAGLAVCRMLEKFGVRGELKWPNDVFAGGRKLAGILSEMVASAEEIGRIVIGIGTNVNNDPGLETAVSLSALTGKKHDRSEVAAGISDALVDVFSEYFRTGFEPLRQEYLARSCTVGREVYVEDGSGRYEARALDVDGDGFLVVERADGKRIVAAGDVTLREKGR